MDRARSGIIEVEALADEQAALLAEPYVTPELRQSLLSAQIVLYPIKFRDHQGPLFPVGTSDVFQEMREAAELAEFGVELASTDEDYKELALHSEAVVQIVLWVASIASSALGSWLYEYLRKRKATLAKISVTVQAPDGTSKRLKYEGPAEKLDLFKTAIETIAAEHSTQLGVKEKTAIETISEAEQLPQLGVKEKSADE